jgi:hypothetical protein
MSWVKPLDFTPPALEPVKKKLSGRPPKRPIKVRGVIYPSVYEAKKATGCSIYMLYKLEEK